jgi:2'-phosphotransferase
VVPRSRTDQFQMKWQRLKSLNVKFEDIQTAVTDNSKQRFSMKPNPVLKSPPDPKSEDPSDWVIRANQGHSIAIDSAALLVPITLEAGNVPDIVVHGTYYAFYQPILETGGLKKMSRNHIHFSTGLPEDKQGVISGMRNDAEILIYIDIKRSLEDGAVLWWISENGVVLTEGNENGVLETKYFKKVVGRRQDVGVLWEDGEQVGELLQSVRNKKAPSGKGPKGKRENEKSKAKDSSKGKAKDMKELRVSEALKEAVDP